MCFAVNYDAEKAALTDLYRNISISQVNTFAILTKQQELLNSWKEENEEDFKRLLQLGKGLDKDIQKVNEKTEESMDLTSKLFDVIGSANEKLNSLVVQFKDETSQGLALLRKNNVDIGAELEKSYEWSRGVILTSLIPFSNFSFKFLESFKSQFDQVILTTLPKMASSMDSYLSAYDLKLQEFVIKDTEFFASLTQKFNTVEQKINIIDQMIQTSLQGQLKLSQGLDDLYAFQQKATIKLSADFSKVQDDLILLFETTKNGIHVLRDGQDDLVGFLTPMFSFVGIIKDELHSLKWISAVFATATSIFVIGMFGGFGKGVFIRLLLGEALLFISDYIISKFPLVQFASLFIPGLLIQYLGRADSFKISLMVYFCFIFIVLFLGKLVFNVRDNHEIDLLLYISCNGIIFLIFQRSKTF